jgi:bacillithiol system protein YtxJ
MNHASLTWTPIETTTQLDEIVDGSQMKPVLIFKHEASSPVSQQVKMELESDWSLLPDVVDTYIIDASKHLNVANEANEIAGVPEEAPQIFLFADGVTMYDESNELINFKKIKIALKIVNRTFKWMETRV